MNQHNKAVVEYLAHEYYALGRKLFPGRNQMPLVLSWELSGRRAGQADVMANKVWFNPIILEENGIALFLPTIGHEIAHLFATRGHGASWQQVMVAFELPTNRTHGMKTFPASERRVARARRTREPVKTLIQL